MAKPKKSPFNTIQPSVNVSIQPHSQPQLKPKIIWPRFEYNPNNDPGEKNFFRRFVEIDSDTFPGDYAIRQNKNIYEQAICSDNYKDSDYGISLGIKEFWDKFCHSTNILFADSHFDIIHFRRIEFELERLLLSKENSHAMEISIYCRSNLKNLTEYNSKQKSANPRIYDIAHISIGKLPDKDLIHDRFAIMDEEIWHCGAAVGGMHGALNAVSRGWKDTENMLRNFLASGGMIYD